jgi:Large eukaryotic DNA virus major capsid protein
LLAPLSRGSHLLTAIFLRFCRRRFAQTSHEYLITQLQHTGSEAIAPASTARTTNVRLNLNHPCKFLAWVVKAASGHNHGAFTIGSATQGGAVGTTNLANGQGLTDDRFAIIKEVKLQLNGHDRFSTRKGSYFSHCIPFEHVKTKPAAGVYLYSFALKPDEHQPSGTYIKDITRLHLKTPFQ